MKRTEYTPEQWNAIVEAPQLAGLAVTVLDFGVVSAIKETTAVVRTIEDAANATDSELLRAIADALDAGAEREPVETSGSKEELLNEMLAKIETAVEHVKAAGSEQDVERYKRLLIDVANAAAGASGSGLFGMGEKISDDERAYLDRLQSLVA